MTYVSGLVDIDCCITICGDAECVVELFIVVLINSAGIETALSEQPHCGNEIT